MARVQICEGCAAVEHTARQPDGWFGYGTSAMSPQRVAVWCAECKAKGIMDSASRTTYRQAVSVAKSRGVLTKLLTADEK